MLLLTIVNRKHGGWTEQYFWYWECHWRQQTVKSGYMETFKRSKLRLKCHWLSSPYKLRLLILGVPCVWILCSFSAIPTARDTKGTEYCNKVTIPCRTCMLNGRYRMGTRKIPWAFWPQLDFSKYIHYWGRVKNADQKKGKFWKICTRQLSECNIEVPVWCSCAIIGVYIRQVFRWLVVQSWSKNV